METSAPVSNSMLSLFPFVCILTKTGSLEYLPILWTLYSSFDFCRPGFMYLRRRRLPRVCGVKHRSNMPFLAAGMTICILKVELIWKMAYFATTVTGFLLCFVFHSHYNSAEHANKNDRCGIPPSLPECCNLALSYYDHWANYALKWSWIRLMKGCRNTIFMWVAQYYSPGNR